MDSTASCHCRFSKHDATLKSRRRGHRYCLGTTSGQSLLPFRLAFWRPTVVVVVVAPPFRRSANVVFLANTTLNDILVPALLGQ